MKKFIAASFLIMVSFVSGDVLANCTAGTLVDDANAELVGNTVCGIAANGDTWQEFHSGDGTLIDFKLGAPAPGNVDPTQVVGSWSASNIDGTVTYTYTGGSIFVFELHQQGNQNVYFFCQGGAVIVDASLIAGSGPC